MKSLSKQDLIAWGQFATQAEKLWDEVMGAHAALADAVGTFNALVNEGEGASMVEDWAGNVAQYMEERSEKWLEGERGQAYEMWHAALSDLAGQIVEVDEPDEPDEPEWISADLPVEPDL